MSAHAVSLVSMGPFVSNVKLGGKFYKKYMHGPRSICT